MKSSRLLAEGGLGLGLAMLGALLTFLSADALLEALQGVGQLVSMGPADLALFTDVITPVEPTRTRP